MSANFGVDVNPRPAIPRLGQADIEPTETLEFDLRPMAPFEAFQDAAAKIRNMSADPRYSVAKKIVLLFPATEEYAENLRSNLPTDIPTEIGPGLKNVKQLAIFYGPQVPYVPTGSRLGLVDTQFDEQLVDNYWKGVMPYLPNVLMLMTDASLKRTKSISLSSASASTKKTIIASMTQCPSQYCL